MLDRDPSSAISRLVPMAVSGRAINSFDTTWLHGVDLGRFDNVHAWRHGVDKEMKAWYSVKMVEMEVW